LLRAVLPAVLMAAPLAAQPGVLTRELLIEYTPEWKGERFPDGRPKVPDAILKRMRTVTLEEAWAVVKGAGGTAKQGRDRRFQGAGYGHEYGDNWYTM